MSFAKLRIEMMRRATSYQKLSRARDCTAEDRQRFSFVADVLREIVDAIGQAEKL